MSLATWIVEFCPVDAAMVEAKDAVEHSLRKWAGLNPTNLERHEVRRMGVILIDGKTQLRIDDSTCALCAIYLDFSDHTLCAKCPLSIARGGVNCSSPTPAERSTRDPYMSFISDGDPEPMIRWLTAARDLEKLKESA